MKKIIARRLALGFAVLALLLAFVAAMQVAPAIHAAVNAVSHSSVVDYCPSAGLHC